MADPKPAGPLGTSEPSSFDIAGRAIKEFDKLLVPVNKLAPFLPLPAQKAVKVITAEHQKRNKNLLEVPDPDDAAATFKLGPPVAPDMNFDHGFLDRMVGDRHVIDESKRVAPTKRDLERYRLWDAAALGAWLVRPDLTDAILAYEHFLHGNGAPFRFAYERFVANDDGGRRVLESALADTKQGAVELARALATIDDPNWQRTFQMVSGVVSVSDSGRYPYPTTDNWQKTIGGHALWISASVGMGIVRTRNVITLEVAMTLHAADMYNFDPGKQDIASGLPDAENGRFELTGLGHEFVQTGEALRTFSLEAPLPPPRPFPGVR